MQPEYPARARRPVPDQRGQFCVLHLNQVGHEITQGPVHRLDECAMTMLVHPGGERCRFGAARGIVALDDANRAQSGEIGKAARIVERRLVADQHDVVVRPQTPQQLGHPAGASVARREHRERRDQQQPQPGRRRRHGIPELKAVRRCHRHALASRAREARWRQRLRWPHPRTPISEHAGGLRQRSEFALARVR